MGPEEREKYLSRDLRIHRKYILVLAVVQFIFIFGGVEFKRINFVGFIADIEKPEIIQYAVLILIVYSLIRYYQYLDTDCFGYIRSNYGNTLDHQFKKFAVKSFISDFRSDGRMAEDDTFHDQFPFSIKQFRDSGKDYIVADSLGFTVQHLETKETRQLNVRNKQVKKGIIKRLMIKSYFIYVFRRPYFFELLVPPILGLLSFVLGLRDVIMNYSRCS